MKVINKFLLSFFLIQFMYLGYSQSDTNSNDVQKKIKIDGVAAVVGDYVILESDVDKTLIGGLIVRVGSRMVDSSIRTKLQRLQIAMKGVG